MDAYQNLISGDKVPWGVQDNCYRWFGRIVAYIEAIFWMLLRFFIAQAAHSIFLIYKTQRKELQQP
ncbi:MAG: hypothetical protein IJ347_05325, partial [Faecalibacterium sp.]|nr:hypothetical protein [Faecalibacterium sp.]